MSSCVSRDASLPSPCPAPNRLPLEGISSSRRREERSAVRRPFAHVCSQVSSLPRPRQAARFKTPGKGLKRALLSGPNPVRLREVTTARRLYANDDAQLEGDCLAERLGAGLMSPIGCGRHEAHSTGFFFFERIRFRRAQSLECRATLTHRSLQIPCEFRLTSVLWLTEC